MHLCLSSTAVGVRAQAWTTLILLKGSLDAFRQQVFPGPVNLIEIGSQKEMGEEREDTDGGKGKLQIKEWEKGRILKEDKGFIC